MPTVVVHVVGEDPFVAEIEELPTPTDQSVTFVNPRRRDNKPLHYVEDQNFFNFKFSVYSQKAIEVCCFIVACLTKTRCLLLR